VKRAALVFLLLALILLELWILEGFLPYGWRHPVSELFNYVFPSKPYPQHDMALEFELFFRDHLLWRIGAYAVIAIFAIANGVLISKVWKALRKS